MTLAVNDELKRPLFRKDDTLLDTVTSKEFQDLLLTDPAKKVGQVNIAKYFGITKEWTETKHLWQKKGKKSDSASFYFYLLLTVKYQSSRDYIWISFYKGLHRYAALLLSLTLSAFNLTKNEIKFKSLTTNDFQQQQLEHFKDDKKQPHKRLSGIFDGTADAQMLTKPFNLKGIIPNKADGAIKVNAAADFTKKLTMYSELISNSKKTSAANSISSLLSKTLDQAQQMSTLEERNSTTYTSETQQ